MKSFVYLHCDDLAKARAFYSELLGLPEIYFSIEEQSVGYLVGTLQLTVSTHPRARPVADWSAQLGWGGGTGADASWGFELDARQFRHVVGRLEVAGATTHQDQPEWVGYWSHRVKDPMGNTVEISSPDPDAWSDTA